jgi:hypothetical protein
MTFRKKENVLELGKKKLWSTICGEFDLEEATGPVAKQTMP